MIGANQPSIRFHATLELVTPIETKYPKYRLAYWGGDMGYMLMLSANLTGRRDKATGVARLSRQTVSIHIGQTVFCFVALRAVTPQM